MNGKVLVGIGAVVLTIGGYGFTVAHAGSPSQVPVTAMTSCAWTSAGDSESSVIARFDGPDDCQSAFTLIAGTGFNWASIGPNWDYGQLECALTSGAEHLRVYEVDYIPYPLTASGPALCSATEQA
jgi:hypothetical protein